MTTGEGGLVVPHDKAYARWMILFSDKAWGYGDPKPDHYFLVLDYRMTDLQGAVARPACEARRRRRAPPSNRRAADRAPPRHARTHVAGARERLDARLLEDPLIVDLAVITGGSDALGAALKANGVFCVPRYIQKPAFQCEVFAKRKTLGTSQFPYSYREREDGTKQVSPAPSRCLTLSRRRCTEVWPKSSDVPARKW